MYTSSVYFSRGNSFFQFWIATVHAHNPFTNVNLDILWDFLFYSFFSWITMVPQFHMSEREELHANVEQSFRIRSNLKKVKMTEQACHEMHLKRRQSFDCMVIAAILTFFDHPCKTFPLNLQLSLICFYSPDVFMDSTLHHPKSFKTCS